MRMEQEEQQQQQQQQSLSMYEKLGRIGEGTYGVVYQPEIRRERNRRFEEMRMDREKDSVPITTLQEVRMLQHCCYTKI